MTEEDLKEYKIKLAEDEKELKEELMKNGATDEEINEAINKRNLYLKSLADGTIQGPPTGYASIDKQWLKYYSDDVIKSEMPNSTIYQQIYEKNQDNLDAIALEYYGNTITYRGLFENIEKTEKVLVNKGVKEGDIVALSMPTTPETIYLLYALSKMGAVANMIDPRTSEHQIAEYVNESKSKLFIGIDLYSEKFKSALVNTEVENVILTSANDSLPKGLKTLAKIKDFFGGNKLYADNVSKYSDELEKTNNVVLPEDYNNGGNNTVVIVHTGGTTGPSKGVMLSNNSLSAPAAQAINDFEFLREDTWLNIMPPFIAYGCGNGLHFPLLVGMKVVLIPKFDPTKFADLLLKYKPQYMAGVPAHYENIINNPKMVNQDLSFWKLAIVGGDSMDLNLEKETRKFFVEHNSKAQLLKGYGMSEASAAVSLPTNEENNKLKSVGIPLDHTTIGIFDKNGNEVQTNQIGEIYISGPNLMEGYINNPDETNNVLKEHEDGKKWMHSGDLGYMDNDGNLYIMDREKRLIVRHDGFKIFPSIIEDLINSNDMVDTCKVIGIHDEEHVQGKLPKAFIVLKEQYRENENMILEEISNICSQRLSEYYLPITFEVREKLPLTPIGKIDYKKLEEEEKENKSMKNK